MTQLYIYILFHILFHYEYSELSWWLSSKEFACSAGDVGSIPGREDPLEEGTATHFSILAWKIPMDRGVWWVMIHRVANSQT